MLHTMFIWVVKALWKQMEKVSLLLKYYREAKCKLLTMSYQGCPSCAQVARKIALVEQVLANGLKV